MRSLSHRALLGFDSGHHFASESHLRIQVVPVPQLDRGPQAALFAGYHGELLIICLKGQFRVQTEDKQLDLAEMDQALLIEAEPFRIVGLEGQPAVAQLIWAPGPNPCRVCWEGDGIFFNEP